MNKKRKSTLEKFENILKLIKPALIPTILAGIIFIPLAIWSVYLFDNVHEPSRKEITIDRLHINEQIIMNKKEIDRLIENVVFDCFNQTVEACRKEWGIDFKGKDSHLMYPTPPKFPDTQEEVIKAIEECKGR